MNSQQINPLQTVACKLIGIYGHARSGKDTAANYVREAHHENTYKLAFADPLKEAAARMFGLDDIAFYDDILKEQLDEYWGVSPRKMVQFFGTEMVRNNVNRLIPGIEENFWIARMIQRLNGYGDSPFYDDDDVVIIPDVRFQNEYDWIIRQGGIIIHLTREGADGTVGIPGHPSEAGIDFTEPDQTYLITNNSTLEDLYAQVDSILTQANIYPFSNPDSF